MLLAAIVSKPISVRSVMEAIERVRRLSQKPAVT
jgi:hypothetical protein